MNEFLRQFIMRGIRDMIKKDVALYQTYQYASGWFSKGVLTQEDLEEIQALYNAKEQTANEEPVAEETAEITAEETAETAEEVQ